MVQISGSQPPLEAQKVATSPWALTWGWSAWAARVPEVPRLRVIMPGAILPVPMAPSMLSPPPVATQVCGLRPRAVAACSRKVPMQSPDSSNSGSAAKRRSPGSMC